MSRQVAGALGTGVAANHNPIYLQVKNVLEQSICNDYQLGEYLPSEKELSKRFSVNRHTIRRAVDELVSAGLVLRKQGKGSMIINNQIEYSLKAGRFTATLDKLRRDSRSELISSQQIPCPPKVSNYLGIDVNSPVILIETLRFVDEDPISLITHFLNPQLTPEADSLYRGGSLHEFIEQQYSIQLIRTSALISAINPTNEEAFLLKSALTQPLLKIKSFNVEKQRPESMVEVSISRSRSDRFQIKVPCLE